MNTSEYIRWAQKRTGKQVTDDEMRVLVNTAQNQIFSYNTYYNKKKPENSCYFPTQAGVLQYTFDDPLIRTIETVYYYDDYGDKSEVPVEVDFAIEPGDSVVVYFSEDPGTTIQQYYYDAYMWPFNGQVTSTSIPLSLPETIQTEYLFFKISKMLEVDKDGRSIYNADEEKRLNKEYFTFANKGARLYSRIPDDMGV